MAYVRIPYDNLKAYCLSVYQKIGFTAEESEIIANVLLQADIYGIESHGVQRTVLYHKYIKSGATKINAEIEIVKETPNTAVIDGHFGMGQVIGHKAMSLAIEKAKKNGIGMVMVRNSSHYGIAGYYAKMACDQGLIGLSVTNSAKLTAPTGGCTPVLGSNPIAVAAPADPYPFFFDIATANVAFGKLEVAAKQGKTIPDTWAMDERGRPTTDPVVGMNAINSGKGGLFPVGAHKGYGFALLVELMCSILSLGPTSLVAGKGGVSHGFMAIDPACFGDPAEIKKYFSDFLAAVRNSPKAEGKDRIYTHGEIESEATADRMKNGLMVAEKTLEELYDFASFVGMDDADKYLKA